MFKWDQYKTEAVKHNVTNKVQYFLGWKVSLCYICQNLLTNLKNLPILSTKKNYGKLETLKGTYSLCFDTKR